MFTVRFGMDDDWINDIQLEEIIMIVNECWRGSAGWMAASLDGSNQPLPSECTMPSKWSAIDEDDEDDVNNNDNRSHR